MRIALVTNGLEYGGAERVVQALAEDLHAAGEQVWVFATTREGPIAEELRAAQIPVELLGIRGALDGRPALKLRRRLKEAQIQLVHSHLAVADIVAASAASMRWGRPKLVTTVHNPGVQLGAGKATLWRLSLRRFDRVYAVSEAVQDSLPGWTGASLRHPCLVSGSPALSRGEARAALGLGEWETVVLAVGRLQPVKGLDILKAAAEQLPAQIRVLVIGEGPERARLEGGRLELLGARGDADALVAAADVLALPSRSEGFPQVPLAAMACGVPVVATAVGGSPELVIDGQTGRLVAPEDPAALARGLLDTLDRVSEFGQAGRRALQRRKLSRQHMTAQAIEDYRRLLGRPTDPGAGRARSEAAAPARDA